MMRSHQGENRETRSQHTGPQGRRQQELARVMEGNGQVIVEFYGVPRKRAGRAAIAVAAGTIAEILHAVARACPGLADVVQDSQLNPHYLASRDGHGFVVDLQLTLLPGERLLLLSKDAGG
jgi:hypothetical protein